MFLAANLEAASFEEATKKLASHASIEAIKYYSKAEMASSDQKGSWGDPSIKLAFKNFPKDNLSDDKSPMTGIELSLSQKISLTTKYGNYKNASKSKAKALEFEALDSEKKLLKILWETLVIRKKRNKDILILKENFNFLKRKLKISKKLYANGKISQQALLELQIRISQLEVQINNVKSELLEISDEINYLVGFNNISEMSIPWNLLSKINKKKNNDKDKMFKQKLQASEFNLTASRQDFIPDLTFSIGATKRSNIDDNGDFLSASISFPLPFSDIKSANKNKAINEKYKALKEYDDYKNRKKRKIFILQREIKKIAKELAILKNRTIIYAKNSRTITSKSYGLGGASYIELLQSELKLQKILLQRNRLEAKLDITKVNLKYILGEPLK